MSGTCCEGTGLSKASFPAYSSLDRLGLSDRPYRKTQRLVFHLYAVLLGYGLLKLMAYDPAWRFLLAQLGGEVVCGFPELALEQFPHVPS